MKPKINIVYSYYYSDLMDKTLVIATKLLEKFNFDFEKTMVPGSFEIPFAIAKSIKEDTSDKKDIVSSFKQKGKNEIRDNIVQMAKLSQLNLNDKCIYSGYLALGCIIKGETINHQAISTSIFTNIQKISVDNVMPISNGIFNANNLNEAKTKYEKCTSNAVNVLNKLVNYDGKKT